jgi:hypothetical protein
MKHWSVQLAETRSPGHRFATLYDTAKRCLIIVDEVYSDLEKHLESIRDTGNTMNKSQIGIKIYMCVFSFIDFGHRFVQIVDAMPLLPKKRPEVKKLHSVMSALTSSRNYVQHIRNHLSKTESIDFPILGSMAWIADQRNYVLLPTQLTEGYGAPSIAYDTKEARYVCKYQFTIESHQIAIDIIYGEMKTFWKWLDGIAHITPAEIKTYEWSGPNLLSSEFGFGPNASGGV